MSKTMLSRLAMLEVLDSTGPLTITELARRAGLDVAVVSRTVSACEPDGWLVRRGNRVGVGPRCALLGHTSGYIELFNLAARLTHALSGVTGLTANAVGLIGHDTVVFAASEGVAPPRSSGLAAKAPLHATAGGVAIGTQLPDEELARVLGPEPYPDGAQIIAGILGTSAEVVLGPSLGGAPTADLPRTAEEFSAQMHAIRTDGYGFDAGGLDPTINCLAVAWPRQLLPAALACLGTPEAVAAGREVALRALTAAAAPGATIQAVLAAGA